MRIAVTKASGSENYKKYIIWLKSVESDAEFIDLSSISYDSALSVIECCHGLVVTGGHDIYPGLYGMEDDTSLCGKFDRKRDSLETSAIKAAKVLKMPVLGICRGLQIINVVYGGSLYADIPTQVDNPIIHSRYGSLPADHQISTLKGSRLNQITAPSGIVNSFHHQTIRHLASNFIAVAFSEDGLIEAFENRGNQGSIMAVQWHPERMDSSNVFAVSINTWFLNNARRYKVLKSKGKL